MRAWIVSEKKYGVIGARRFVAETDIVRPEAISKDEIDRDEDIVCVCNIHYTREKAIEAARAFLLSQRSCFWCGVRLRGSFRLVRPRR